MITCEPAAIVGAAGVAAGVVPCVITSGLYTWTEPFGARMVASTNACSAELAIEQPSPSTHGVARPCADSGLAGAVMVQVPDAAAWSAFWFRLSALPAPSTGALARLPSCLKAVGPLALLAAGATAAAAAVAVAAAAGAAGEADVHGAALALAAVAGALAAAAAGEAEAEAQVPRADWAIWVAPPFETARTMPRVRPSATGMARGIAIRAARL